MLAFSESPLSSASTQDIQEDAQASRLGPSTQAEPLAALEGEVLNERFRSWQGASGRRYIFSVFDPVSCPAYCDAVLIVAAVDAKGWAKPLAVVDTGPFPEPLLARIAKSFSGAGGPRREFHLHLLANNAAERRAVLRDLSQRL